MNTFVLAMILTIGGWNTGLEIFPAESFETAEACQEVADQRNRFRFFQDENYGCMTIDPHRPAPANGGTGRWVMSYSTFGWNSTTRERVTEGKAWLLPGLRYDSYEACNADRERVEGWVLATTNWQKWEAAGLDFMEPQVIWQKPEADGWYFMGPLAICVFESTGGV